MIRRAFTLRLKPGALAEYKEKHDNIWPELVAEIESAGDWRNDHRRLREFVTEWIHDREDPKLEVNFDFHGRGRL